MVAIIIKRDGAPPAVESGRRFDPSVRKPPSDAVVPLKALDELVKQHGFVEQAVQEKQIKQARKGKS